MTRVKAGLAILAMCSIVAVSAAQEAEESGPTVDSPVNPTAITLEKEVFFVGTDGAPVRVEAGDYVVDAAYGTLVLFDSDGIARAIQARWESHDLELEFPIVVSLAGDSEEEEDYHFLSVLMPGGSGLEAGGTYSGVRPRGLLKAAKNRVQTAAQNTRKKVQATRENVRTTVQQTTQQVAGAIQEQAQQVAGNVAQSVGSVLPTAELQLLIQAANQLGLPKLLACLNDARGQRGQDLIGMISQLQSNPVGLLQNLESGIRQDVMSTFSQIAAPGLQLMRTGQIPAAGQLVGASFSSLNAVAQKGPLAKCVFDFAKPYLPAIQRGADQAVNQAQAEMQKLFNDTVQPLMEQAIVAGLKPVIKAARSPIGLSPTEKQMVAMGVYARSMTYQFGVATGEIRTAINSGDPAAVRAAIKKSEEWTDKAALSFGFEMIRVRGRRALDEHITTKVTAAIGTLSLSKDTIGSIVDAVCGLVPEVGAAACALIKYPIKVGWNVVGITAIKVAAKQAIRRSYEAYMACEANRLGISISNEVYLPKLGILDAGTYEKIDVRNARICNIPNPWSALFEDRKLLDQAVHEVVASDLPKDMQTTIANYNAALIELANRWEADRRRR